MSNEPFHNAEKRLQAWAQKRREAAGAPLELHPATRKFLQDEVARTLTDPKAKPAPASPRPVWWPRLAFGGAVFATLVFVLFVVQADRKQKETAFYLAKGEVTKAPVSASPALSLASDPSGVSTPSPLREEAEQLVVDAEMRRARVTGAAGKDAAARDKNFAPAKSPKSVMEGDRSPVAGEPMRRNEIKLETESLKKTATAELAPPQAADKPLPALAAAPPAAPLPSRMVRADHGTVVAGVTAGVAVAAMNKTALATGKVLAATNATASANAGSLAFEKAQLMRQRYAQVDNYSQYRKNPNSPPFPQVLTTFQVEISGDKLRVTDADGSVYEGQMLATTIDGLAPAPAKAGLSQNEGRLSGDRNIAANFKEDAAKPETKTKAPQTNGPLVGRLFRTESQTVRAGYDFEVSGTNRSLQQAVVFRGNFAGGTGGYYQQSAAPLEQAKQLNRPDQTVNLRQAGAEQNQLFNAVTNSIRGRASVGGKNEFDIEAQPMK